MNELEKRIMQVSEMLSEHFMEGALGFQHSTAPDSSSLWDAQELLTPDILRVRDCIGRMCTKHKLGDRLIDDALMQSSTTSYAIGIIAGLQVAGRSDLIPKFARAYAETTKGERLMWEYTEDGGYYEDQKTGSAEGPH
jgi:hypothetical protein